MTSGTGLSTPPISLLGLRSEYTQAGGETVLAGGILATRSSARIIGGEITGSGTVVCPDLRLGDGATLSPGTPLTHDLAKSLPKGDSSSQAVVWDEVAEVFETFGERPNIVQVQRDA